MTANGARAVRMALTILVVAVVVFLLWQLLKSRAPAAAPRASSESPGQRMRGERIGVSDGPAAATGRQSAEAEYPSAQAIEERPASAEGSPAPALELVTDDPAGTGTDGD